MESEVEVRFIPNDDGTTRVELEHRITAVDAEAIVSQVSAPGGWGSLLELYVKLTEAI
jgi:uncharacterized protein YndB with AHSA1/START domain